MTAPRELSPESLIEWCSCGHTRASHGGSSHTHVCSGLTPTGRACLCARFETQATVNKRRRRKGNSP